MKLTKYGHACIVLEEQGKKLVIDPGSWTPEFGGTDNIVAVVVTHVHADHFSPDQLQAIVTANPDVKVFTTPQVAASWNDPHASAVKNGEEQTIEPFRLRFLGELHALIDPMKAQDQNIGVMVNDVFYDPGDSFTPPDTQVEVLALPVNAPWAKVAESIEFVKAVQPKQFFGIHDGLLSENGRMVYDIWFKMASEKFNIPYNPIEPGQSIEI